MTWNWQQDDWPNFIWNRGALVKAEEQFLRQSGILVGATAHVNEEDKSRFVVDLITGEAVKTSEIEGEYLDRDSVQSSILRNLGLSADHRRVEPAERGIADMMTDLYEHHHAPLSHRALCNWHKTLTNGRQDIQDVGRYRSNDDPMQVVSNRLDKPKVYFEAPPSTAMQQEMDMFTAWWRKTAAKGKQRLPTLTRAGIAHLYFVCIHPFEDGNGRIARALAEKSLAEHQGEPSLIALSQTIERDRKAYYGALERNNKCIEITDWLVYFADTILGAQRYSLDLISFLIEKTKLYDRLNGKLNMRQEKVLTRMFREGPDGFKGGLSAENYISITGTSRATATRDCQDLVDKGGLRKTGVLKSTRYYLNIESMIA